jgi:hypothetical protein
METAASAPSRARGSTGAWIGASLVGALALLLLATGAAGLWARFGASDHGYVTSGSHRYTSTGRAIVSGALDADGIPSWLVAKARLRASSVGGGTLFVGVARRADVDRYLAGVARTTIEDVDFSPFDVTSTSAAGDVVPAPPARQTFWVRAQTGRGGQTLSWNIRNGTWRVVVMNADASRRVAIDARAGVTIRGALAIALSALGAGLALAAAAGALVVGARRRR